MIVSATGPGIPRPQASPTGLSASPRSETSFGQHADQRVVVHAVVLALELHDLVAAGVGPGDPHRVHRGVGAGRRHACHLDPAGQLAQELHGPDLVLRGQGEADAATHALADVVVDAVVGMPEEDGPIAHPQVDVLVAVEIPDAAALAAIDVDRAVAPGAEVGVGATGQRPDRPPVHRGLDVALQAGSGEFGGHDSSALLDRLVRAVIAAARGGWRRVERHGGVLRGRNA